MLVMVTVALGTAASLLSRTLPTISPYKVCETACAGMNVVATSDSRTTIASRWREVQRMLIIGAPLRGVFERIIRKRERACRAAEPRGRQRDRDEEVHHPGEAGSDPRAYHLWRLLTSGATSWPPFAVVATP